MSSAGPRDASLVLVRHGRTTWVDEGRFQGSSDVPLSAQGRAQAAAVGSRLARTSAPPALPIPDGSPRTVRHSPLARAADTAAAIAGARGSPDSLVADLDLREVGQGAWEGLRHDEVKARWPDEYARWRHDPIEHRAPGAESLDEASIRAGLALGRLLEDVGGGPRATDGEHGPWAIAVAHDGILRLVLLRLLGLPLERYWAFPFAPCGITIVEIRDARVRLRAHNLEGYLPGPEG